MRNVGLGLRGLNHRISEFVGTASAPPPPFVLGLNVTGECSSRCKTCKGWTRKNEGNELEVWEWDKLLSQIGHNIGFYTFSGGEPFMRRDLPELLFLPFKYGNPRYLTIATNCLFPKTIRDYFEEFFQKLEGRDLRTEIYCNLSIDGIGRAHDEVRGVEGNFAKVLETIEYLREIRAERPQLKIGIHTVISKFNLNQISQIYDHFLPLDYIDSMGCSIAEHRNELVTTEEPIASSNDDTLKILNMLASRVSPHKNLNGTLKSLRIGYYEFLKKWMTSRRQPLSCFAALSSCQVTWNGNVVSCGSRWVEEGLIGNLRDANYDFNKIWNSDNANRLRKAIRRNMCSCPQLHVYYGTVTCHPVELAKIFFKRIVPKYLYKTRTHS